MRVLVGAGGDWWPLRESEEEEEEEGDTEEGWPLEGVAFPGNGFCSALSGPPLSAEDLLPRAPEAGTGEALSRLMTLRCARLPSQLGLQTSVL